MNKWQVERDALFRRWYGRIPGPLRSYGRSWPQPVRPTDYLQVPPPQADANMCHIWRGKLCKYGYGHLLLDNNSVLAHRTAYIQANGPLPKEDMLHHTCDRPYCVQPAHMYTGPAVQTQELPAILTLPHFNLFTTPDSASNVPNPILVSPASPANKKKGKAQPPVTRTARIHHSTN